MKNRPQILVVVLLLLLSAWLILRWREQPYQQPYHLIEDGLYLGEAVTEPPIGTQAVVNVCGRPDPYEVEHVLHLPVLEQGNSQPTVEWLQKIVAFIDEQRDAERTVYVHCSAGMNRSPTAVAAYLMFKHEWTADEALRYLQQKRPLAGPNPQLQRLLKDWEKHLADERADAEE